MFLELDIWDFWTLSIFHLMLASVSCQKQKKIIMKMMRISYFNIFPITPTTKSFRFLTFTFLLTTSLNPLSRSVPNPKTPLSI